ncbi:MAG: alpha-amylase family glycosyl hydrolase [Ktedonobacteraceae bacterium]
MTHAHSWWQTGVIYQIYPRSFLDSNGDGIGDLSGITSKLDYLQWLGIDALWLSPIYPSPMADFGYDITNYTDVHPLFGTLEDVDTLLEQAHQRDLKVILDFVPNHTSDEHPWFQQARESRTNEKRDWYIWRDPAPNGGPPNNWISNFGGSAWHLDEPTGQYYLHMFDVKQPDLNWRHQEVRQAMYAVMRFWLERGIDGFRVDALHALLEDEQFRDNPLNPAWKPGDPPFTRQLGRYTEDQPGMQDISLQPELMLDPQGKDNPKYSRDPARSPMQWNGSVNAGFCSAGVKPWLPIADDFQTYNVTVEQHDPRSFVTLVCRLLALRRALPALTLGSQQSIDQPNAACFVYQRQYADQRCLVILNFSAQEQVVALPEQEQGRLLLSTHLDREGPPPLSDVHLRGNEGLLIEMKASSP